MACEKVGNAIVCGPRPRYSRRLQKKETAAALNFWKPLDAKLELGCEYIVSKYWTGTFRGRLEWISETGSVLRFQVTDAMRPGPLIEEKCCFPECVAHDGHDGDHVFMEFRNGGELEVQYGLVHLVRVP